MIMEEQSDDYKRGIRDAAEIAKQNFSHHRSYSKWRRAGNAIAKAILSRIGETTE